MRCVVKVTVKVGEDFEGVSCDLDEKEEKKIPPRSLPKKAKNYQQGTVNRIQFFVVKAVMVATIAAVVVTGLYGLLTRDWSLLASTLDLADPAVRAIISR